MPPKTSKPGAGKKAEVKKVAKVVEDKTFGLKNKKGAKTQKFIENVKKCHNPLANGPKKTEPTKKEEKQKELAELNQIFKPVATQKVAVGVDPKSVLCAFYKQGQCKKGEKCKFSHDVNIERKGEKRSAYVDARDNDLMEDWDEEKLKEVVEKKHGELERKLPKTDIICKHFLEALETSKYGWFWECPNGGLKCHYKHALPPGFVLNKDRKKMEKKEDISIEDLVERERAKLGGDLIRITLESFLAWKKKKIGEKRENAIKEQERKRAEFKAGKNLGLSGRDMFTFNPDLVLDDQFDEDEAAFDDIREYSDEDEEGVTVKEISLEALAQQAREADGSGTQVTDRQFQVEETKKEVAEEGAAAGAEAEAAGAAAGGASSPGLEDALDNLSIDEDLYDDDLDDEELNGVE
jgi:hypothetical protein